MADLGGHWFIGATILSVVEEILGLGSPFLEIPGSSSEFQVPINRPHMELTRGTYFSVTVKRLITNMSCLTQQ